MVDLWSESSRLLLRHVLSSKFVVLSLNFTRKSSPIIVRVDYRNHVIQQSRILCPLIIFNTEQLILLQISTQFNRRKEDNSSDEDTPPPAKRQVR